MNFVLTWVTDYLKTEQILVVSLYNKSEKINNSTQITHAVKFSVVLVVMQTTLFSVETGSQVCNDC